MKKPKALKTPWGDFGLNCRSTSYVDCSKCGGDMFYIKGDVWRELGSDTIHDWRAKNWFCHLCRPDLYVWEDDGWGTVEVNGNVTFKTKPGENGYTDCRYEIAPIEPQVNTPPPIGIKDTKTSTPPPPQHESKPLRYVGHLKGCWAVDRYQDNEHCGCWRIIASDSFESYKVVCDAYYRPIEVVGLPDTKLRSDWD